MNSRSSDSLPEPVSSNAATGPISNSVLMTCRFVVHAPDGSLAEARALLDSGIVCVQTVIIEFVTRSLSSKH